MTSTQVSVVSTLQADDLKAALRRLAPNVQQSVLRKGMRRGLKPMEVELQAEWKRARYRGRPIHRYAIAAATQTDARRRGSGMAAPIVGRVGVRYGGKGGALAKGRQKVWHLLEAGFARYPKGSGAYTGYSPAVAEERTGYRKAVAAARTEIFKQKLPKAKRKAAMQAMYAGLREQFPAFVAERTARATRRQSLRSIAANVVVKAGAWISKKTVRRMMDRTLRAVRDETLAAAAQALKGGRRGNR